MTRYSNQNYIINAFDRDKYDRDGNPAPTSRCDLSRVQNCMARLMSVQVLARALLISVTDIHKGFTFEWADPLRHEP